MASNNDPHNPFADPAVVNAQANQSSPSAQPTFAFGYNAPSIEEPSAQYKTQEKVPPPYTSGVQPRIQASVQPQNAIASMDSKPNNFPYIPPSWTWCPIKPCFYFNIQEEIPSEFQLMMKYHFYFVMEYACTIILNIIGGISYMILGYPSGVLHFALSLLIGPIFALIVFIFQYWLLYKACKNDNPNYYFWYLVDSLCILITVIIQTIGPEGSGWSGLMVATRSFSDEKKKSAFMGILSLIIASGFFAFMIKIAFTAYKIRFVYMVSKHRQLSNALARQNQGGTVVTIPIGFQ